MSKVIHNQKEFMEAMLAGETVVDGLAKWKLVDDAVVVNSSMYLTLPNNFFGTCTKPKTFFINGIELALPERVAPSILTVYYLADITIQTLYYKHVWNNDFGDTQYLSRGLVHLTKENAIAHAKALLSLMEV